MYRQTHSYVPCSYEVYAVVTTMAMMMSTIEPMKANQNQPRKLRILGVQLAPWCNWAGLPQHQPNAHVKPVVDVLVPVRFPMDWNGLDEKVSMAILSRSHWFARLPMTWALKRSRCMRCPVFSSRRPEKQRPKNVERVDLQWLEAWKERYLMISPPKQPSWVQGPAMPRTLRGYEKAAVFHKFVVSWLTFGSVSRDRVN